MNKLFFGGVHPQPHKELSALGKVDTLIANACECEPYITADDTLPHTVPYWQAVLGSVFAILFVKVLCGGLGQNVFNPALAARA